MKNIYEILKSMGLEVPEEKKSEFDKAWKENYRTKAEYDKAIELNNRAKMVYYSSKRGEINDCQAV